MLTALPFRHTAIRLLPAALALVGVSCNDANALHSVQGKVMQRGVPAKGAVVVFHPKNADALTTLRPSGVVDEQGNFTLSTTKPGDGARAGEYLITIVWREEAKSASSFRAAQPEEAPDKLKGRYSDRNKSGLTAEVKPGRNEIPTFELE